MGSSTMPRHWLGAVQAKSDFLPNLLATPSQFLHCFMFLFFFLYILNKFSACISVLNITYILMIFKFISQPRSHLWALYSHIKLPIWKPNGHPKVSKSKVDTVCVKQSKGWELITYDTFVIFLIAWYTHPYICINHCLCFHLEFTCTFPVTLG